MHTDIQRARTYLLASQNAIEQEVAGLSDAQLGTAPEGGWSIRAIVEHCAIVQEVVLGPCRAQLAAAPPSNSPAPEEIDRIAFEDLPVAPAKFKAPEVVQPTGTKPLADSLERMRKNTAALIEWLETAPDLRDRVCFAPPLRAITDGKHDVMDGYQWIVAAAGHTDRHVRQIRTMKAALTAAAVA